MMNKIIALIKEEDGQGMTEYAMILISIAVVCILAFNLLGGSISAKVTDIGNAI